MPAKVIVRGAIIGASFLAVLLAIAALGSQFDALAELGGLILLVLMLMSAVLADTLRLPMSDGIAIGAFPNSILGWIVGIAGILAIFLAFGLVVSFVIDRIGRLGRRRQ